MRLPVIALAAGALGQQLVMADSVAPASSPVPFSSGFVQPRPPMIESEFKCSWNQHKWNANLSHIASGYLYNSPSNNKVRVDEAFDTTLGSSLFDYNNVTNEGVSNTLWTLSPAIASQPEFFVGYTVPAFPLIPRDILVSGNAVYAGVVQDPYVGEVTAWNILYASRLPTTVLVDGNNVIHGYDYWDPNERTYAITRLFNIVVGKLPSELFNFPQPLH